MSKHHSFSILFLSLFLFSCSTGVKTPQVTINALEKAKKNPTAQNHYEAAVKTWLTLGGIESWAEKARVHLVKAADQGNPMAAWKMYQCTNKMDYDKCWFRKHRKIMQKLTKDPNKVLGYLKTASTWDDNINYKKYVYTKKNNSWSEFLLGVPRYAKTEYAFGLYLALRLHMAKERPDKAKPDWFEYKHPGDPRWLVKNPKWEDWKEIERVYKVLIKPLRSGINYLQDYNDHPSRNKIKLALNDLYVFLGEASMDDDEAIHFYTKGLKNIVHGHPKKPDIMHAIAGHWRNKGNKKNELAWTKAAQKSANYQARMRPEWNKNRLENEKKKRKADARRAEDLRKREEEKLKERRSREEWFQKEARRKARDQADFDQDMQSTVNDIRRNSAAPIAEMPKFITDANKRQAQKGYNPNKVTPKPKKNIIVVRSKPKILANPHKAKWEEEMRKKKKQCIENGHKWNEKNNACDTTYNIVIPGATNKQIQRDQAVNNKNLQNSKGVTSATKNISESNSAKLPKISTISEQVKKAGFKYVNTKEICPDGAYKVESTGGLNYRLCARVVHGNPIKKLCRTVLQYENFYASDKCPNQNKGRGHTAENPFFRAKNFKYTDCECDEKVCRSMMTWTCYQPSPGQSTGNTMQK